MEGREARLDDLSLVEAYTSNPSGSYDMACGIGLNPATGQLWVVGYDGVEGDSRWRIEILSKELNLVKAIRPGINGLARAVVFSTTGNAYIVRSAVVKFDESGSLLKRANLPSYHEGFKAFFLNDKLYAFGNAYVRGYSLIGCFDNGLNLLDEVVLSNNVLFSAGKLTFDGRNVYIAGIDRATGDEE